MLNGHRHFGQHICNNEKSSAKAYIFLFYTLYYTLKIFGLGILDMLYKVPYILGQTIANNWKFSARACSMSPAKWLEAWPEHANWLFPLSAKPCAKGFGQARLAHDRWLIITSAHHAQWGFALNHVSADQLRASRGWRLRLPTARGYGAGAVDVWT